MTVVLGAVLMASPAIASENYVSINGGVSLGQNETFKLYSYEDKVPFKAGFTTSLAVGHSFDDFRVEGELGYQTKQEDYTDGLRAHIYSGLVNGYYDIKGVSKAFTPYVTAGAGVGRIEYVDSSVDGNSAFAYQVGAGVLVSLADNVSADLRFRHFAMTEVTPIENLSFSPSTNSVTLGLNVGF